jgi:hypothetical protein
MNHVLYFYCLRTKEKKIKTEKKDVEDVPKEKTLGKLIFSQSIGHIEFLNSPRHKTDGTNGIFLYGLNKF